MSWCCARPANLDNDAVELKIRDALDNTEAWLARCKTRKAEHLKQRTLNQQRRMKLELSRARLLNEKAHTEEELSRVHSELIAIDGYFTALEEAENELERVESDLAVEEAEMSRKEGIIKDHLASITTITQQQAQTPRGTPQAVTVIPTLPPEHKRGGCCVEAAVTASPLTAAVLPPAPTSVTTGAPSTVSVMH